MSSSTMPTTNKRHFFEISSLLPRMLRQHTPLSSDLLILSSSSSSTTTSITMILPLLFIGMTSLLMGSLPYRPSYYYSSHNNNNNYHHHHPLIFQMILLLVASIQHVILSINNHDNSSHHDDELVLWLAYGPIMIGSFRALVYIAISSTTTMTCCCGCSSNRSSGCNNGTTTTTMEKTATSTIAAAVCDGYLRVLSPSYPMACLFGWIYYFLSTTTSSSSSSSSRSSISSETKEGGRGGKDDQEPTTISFVTMTFGLYCAFVVTGWLYHYWCQIIRDKNRRRQQQRHDSRHGFISFVNQGPFNSRGWWPAAAAAPSSSLQPPPLQTTTILDETKWYEWTSSSVVEWIRSSSEDNITIRNLADLIASEDIDGAMMEQLTLSDLRSFGISYGDAHRLKSKMDDLMKNYACERRRERERYDRYHAEAKTSLMTDEDGLLWGQSSSSSSLPATTTTTSVVIDNDNVDNEMAERAQDIMLKKFGLHLPPLKTTDDGSSSYYNSNNDDNNNSKMKNTTKMAQDDNNYDNKMLPQSNHNSRNNDITTSRYKTIRFQEPEVTTTLSTAATMTSPHSTSAPDGRGGGVSSGSGHHNMTSSIPMRNDGNNNSNKQVSSSLPILKTTTTMKTPIDENPSSSSLPITPPSIDFDHLLQSMPSNIRDIAQRYPDVVSRLAFEKLSSRKKHDDDDDDDVVVKGHKFGNDNDDRDYDEEMGYDDSDEDRVSLLRQRRARR